MTGSSSHIAAKLAASITAARVSRRGDDRGVALFVLQQSHLAEELAGSQSRDLDPVAPDAHAPLQDHEESLGLGSDVEQVPVGRHVDGLQPSTHAIEILVGEPREQRHVPQLGRVHVHTGILPRDGPAWARC